MGASSDVADAFVTQFVYDCERILFCDPLDLIAVTFNESDCRTYAHNKNGHASGLWQFMPATALGCGWDSRDCIELFGADGKRSGKTAYGTSPLARFRELDHLGQWIWFRRYFRAYAGRLVNRAACYVATFLPADIGLAANLDNVLVEASGRRSWAYAPNRGFDRDKDGDITVRELVEAIDRTAVGARADDLFARVRAARTTTPELAPSLSKTTPVNLGPGISSAIREMVRERRLATDDDDDPPPEAA